jgi:hypothetical protein
MGAGRLVMAEFVLKSMPQVVYSVPEDWRRMSIRGLEP